MDQDLDMLEEALGYFMRSWWRPKSWEAIQQSAKTVIDRPAASLLLVLGDTASGCRLHELAMKMGVEAPSVTRTVQRLEQDKLVVRTVDPTDRRATCILPTRRGLAVTRALQQAKRERLRLMLDSWSPEDRRQLAVLLHRIAKQTINVATPQNNR